MAHYGITREALYPSYDRLIAIALERERRGTVNLAPHEPKFDTVFSGFHEKQKRIMDSLARSPFFIGGVGSGKTYVLGSWALKKAWYGKGSLGLIAAPVSDTLNNSTIPALQEVWYQMGIEEGRDYVIGKRPPIAWGLKPYTHRNTKVLTWRWGSYTILDGADNYHKHRGTELDYIGIDEYRDLKPEAYDVFVGRLRGKIVKRDSPYPYQILAVSTPPDAPQVLEEMQNDKNVEIIFGSSYDNAHNLPEGYIDSLKERYDEKKFRREVLGELVRSGSVVYYSFTPDNVAECHFDKTARTWLTWDFNYSESPLACLVVQDKTRGSEQRFEVVKEFVFANTNTEEMCRALLTYLTEQQYTGTLTVTGDYAGTRRESNSSFTDYQIIENMLKQFSPRRLTRPTKAIKDRVASLTAMFCNAEGKRRLFVDAKCKALIGDLNKVTWKQSGEGLESKDKLLTHASDALSYFTYNEFPADRPEVTTRHR